MNSPVPSREAPPASPRSLFIAAAERFPDRTFVRHVTASSDRRVSYLEAAARVADHLTQIRALGLEPLDHVVVYGDALVPTLYLDLALAFQGVLFAPLAPAFSVRALRRLMERISARAVLTTTEHVARLQEAGLEPWHHPRPADAPSGERRADWLSALAVLKQAERQRSDDEDFIIYSTSGSTSEPKLPVRTHRAVAVTARWLVDGWQLRTEPAERVLLCSGLTHALGQQNLALALQVGAELSIPEHLEGNVLLDQVRTLDPTVLRANPRVIKSLWKQFTDRGAGGGDRFLGPSLRVVRTSGSKNDSLHILERCQTEGADVGETYGTSETGTVALTPHGGWRPGYIGKLNPAMTWRHAPDGELLVRSPTIMQGYYGDPVVTAQAFTEDGFYKTGDIVEITPEHYVRIIARKADVMNAPDGTNIVVPPIEERLALLPWVSQAVLIGDQYPYVSALVVVNEAIASAHPSGLLGGRAHAALYAQARADLTRINAQLETIEQIRRVALLGAPMAPELYSVTVLGKPKRDRRRIAADYALVIDTLYDPASDLPFVVEPG